MQCGFLGKARAHVFRIVRDAPSWTRQGDHAADRDHIATKACLTRPLDKQPYGLGSGQQLDRAGRRQPELLSDLAAGDGGTRHGEEDQLLQSARPSPIADMTGGAVA